MKRKQQGGFTLIELIVVIVILGILAATAVPKFINVASSARAATINGLSGAMNSAAAVVYSQSVINATNTKATSSVTMADGTSVTTAYGYPDETATGIGVAVTGATSSYTPTYGTGSSTWTVSGATTPASCIVTYTAATASSAATAAATTGGC